MVVSLALPPMAHLHHYIPHLDLISNDLGAPKAFAFSSLFIFLSLSLCHSVAPIYIRDGYLCAAWEIVYRGPFFFETPSAIAAAAARALLPGARRREPRTGITRYSLVAWALSLSLFYPAFIDLISHPLSHFNNPPSTPPPRRSVSLSLSLALTPPSRSFHLNLSLFPTLDDDNNNNNATIYRRCNPLKDALLFNPLILHSNGNARVFNRSLESQILCIRHSLIIKCFFIKKKKILLIDFGYFAGRRRAITSRAAAQCRRGR